MLIKHHKGFDYRNPLEYASPLLHKERPKMIPCTDKYDRVGKNRLKQIHKRVKYLAEECGYKEREKPTYKIHQLCNDCTNKIKYHDRSLVDVSPQTQGVYIRCSGLPWLCRAKDKPIISRRMIFNPYRLMKKMYSGMLENLVYGDCAKNVIYVMQLRSGEDPELWNTLKNASY